MKDPGRSNVVRLVHLSLAFATVFFAPLATQSVAQSETSPTQIVHAGVQALTDVMVHDIFSPPQASRAYAYPLIAYYEAIRKQNPSYISYAGQLNGLEAVPQHAESLAYNWTLAGTQAFMRVAEEMVFSQGMLRSSRDRILEEFHELDVPESVFARSIEYGNQVAEHILGWAATDGYSKSRSLPRYAVASNEPGAWKPTPPAYIEAIEPHWRQLRPFALRSTDQFLVPRPTAFDTAGHAPFYEEMRLVHRVGETLTHEQREIAAFWDCNPFVVHQQGHLSFGMKKITPGGHWMGITRIAIDQRGDGPVEAVAAYSMVALAIADGFLSAWDEKYRSNRIRPETVIRRHLDPDWQPLLQTPPFPEYPSAHSVISRAAAIVLTRLYGEDFSYTDNVEEPFGLAPRHFNSFLEAAEEAAISRLYGGIHYLPAIEAGVVLGQHVGDWVVEHVSPTRGRGEDATESPRLEVSWGVRDNLGGQGASFSSELTIANAGEAPMGAGWKAYFNFGRRIMSESVPPQARIHHINGDFYRLEPAEQFAAIAQGERLSIPFQAANWAIKEVDAPSGFYFVMSGDGDVESRIVAVEVEVEPFVAEEQTSRGPNDILPVPTSASRFEENKSLELLPLESVGKIVPTPKKIDVGDGSWTLDRSTTIRFDPGLDREALFLARSLEPLLDRRVKLEEGMSGAGGGISLRLLEGGAEQGVGDESYRLVVSRDKGVEITAHRPAGVFYGIQSLRALIPVEAYRHSHAALELPVVSVDDAPRFPYRGMHLDVARNFQPKAAVEKLLDLMAFYKLNRFHFHLTEDEGWRLEIRPLPELTEVAGRRGHTLDDSDRLVPSFGSGPWTDVPPGSGYYSREEFIELLAFASERHITVIPEIDVPGHARGAIKAMEARYERHRGEDQSNAGTYRLIDPADGSEYRSVQGWDDNVINVCVESTYRFLEVVVDEILSMYREADAPLAMIHVGGDEVPGGVWERSPACDALVASVEGLAEASDLSAYFKKGVVDLLAARGLAAAGWEEIGLHERHEEGSVEKELDSDLAGGKVVTYFWNSVWGWGAEELGYKLANAGFPVVLSNASNLYFDMAYDKDPKEPGFYWAAFVNTKNVYEFEPLDLYQSARINQMGHAIAHDAYDGHVHLTEEGQRNILGIQGQLWGETVVTPERMEYMAFPRIIALSERAWAARPAWASTKDREARDGELQQAWIEFSNRLGQRELPRLDYLNGGVRYRLPVPGGILEGGMLNANIEFPGIAIHYTVDGTEPTPTSPRYTQPIPISGGVSLRAFDSRGRGGRTSTIP